MRSRGWNFVIAKNCCWFETGNIGCLMLWRELKKEFHSAGKEMLDWSPLGCISSWTLLSINKAILVFSYILVYLYDCISVFDLLLILNHLWIWISAFVLCSSLVASSCSLVTGSCSLVISWESSSCSLEQARRQVAVNTQREEDLDRGTNGRHR